MKSIHVFAVVTSLAIYGCQQPGPSAENAIPEASEEKSTFIEALVRKPGDQIVIPYRKFRLDNGLIVILHEDQSDPLVHIDVTYHVGSAREEVGKSGFAHFFEHMMFQGSDHVADDQHFKIVSESGGSLNGTTNSDRTNYFQTVPSNQLEKILWLEADRMGFLLGAVTQEKFEVQRETVKNERGQRVDNRPYGLLNERVGEALYPPGHPYSWTTIGYVEDLDRVAVNDLKKFFQRWYGPNNATLTIGGAIDEAQTLIWVNKYFGGIPRGPDVSPPQKTQVRLDNTRYISMEDNVALPLLYIAFPTVHLYHPDEAPLDVLNSALGVGKTSLLYKNLVKNGLAVQANSSHACRELACTFALIVLANPSAGKSLADLERITRQSISEFENRGVTDDDLTRVKMSIISQMIYGLESVAGKVRRLAAYQTFTGNPSYAGADIARYEDVTKHDVMRVYGKYILNQPSVVMSIVPRGQLELKAGADSWQPTERKLPEYELTKQTESEYRSIADDFDRTIMPPSGSNPTIRLPEIWRGTLNNGIRILGARNIETPTTAITVRIKAGQRDEPLTKLGLATLTANMLNESTLHKTNEELSNMLQKLGSSIAFSSDDNQTVVTVRALSESLDETMAIVVERLLEPRFDPADFERVRGQMLQSIEQSKKQAANTAQLVYQLLLFGRDNPIAHPDMGTAQTVATLTLEDVKKFYRDHYSPAAASIVVVSNLDETSMMASLSVLQSWQGANAPQTGLKPFPDIGKTKIFLVDKPGAAQSEIRFGKRALKFDATGDFYRAGLANFVLGGTFSSRINLNLREDKGYTYGARSRFRGEEDYGSFTALAAVRTDATAASIVELTGEISRYATEGITADELEFTRSAVGQRDATRFETPAQKLGFLSRILNYNLDDDFIDQQNRILGEISREELNSIASRYMTVDNMVIVVVGDRSVIEPELKTLGYEIVHLDENGNPLVKAPRF